MNLYKLTNQEPGRSALHVWNTLIIAAPTERMARTMAIRMPRRSTGGGGRPFKNKRMWPCFNKYFTCMAIGTATPTAVAEIIIKA